MFRSKTELSAALAEQVLNASEEGLLLFDRNDRVRFCNRAFESIWSLSGDQLTGEALERVLVLIDARTLNRPDLRPTNLEANEPSLPIEIILEDDRYLELQMQPLLERGQRRGRVWRFRDLTVERRSELAMLHSQKLESLGVLAGGMAHDFNNLLSSIMGHSELGLDEVDAESPEAESLRAIGRAAERASELTQQLLAYAGKGTVLVEPVDLSALVREVVELISVSIPDSVQVELDLEEELPPIIADATQIRQVVMNLLLNASESIAEEGRVRISTATKQIDQWEIDQSLHHGDTAPGTFVALRVRDNGSGMDEDTLGRIFDPFFSTKFTGRGLGLAAVLGIVRGHRGLLSVSSKPEKGTTFTVHLPRGYRPESAAP